MRPWHLVGLASVILGGAGVACWYFVSRGDVEPKEEVIYRAPTRNLAALPQPGPSKHPRVAANPEQPPAQSGAEQAPKHQLDPLVDSRPGNTPDWPLRGGDVADFTPEKLRERALEMFTKDARMTTAVMGAWDASFARMVGEMLLASPLPAYGEMESLAYILVFLARREKDTPEGREAREQLDKVYRRAMSDVGDGPASGALWSCAVSAVEDLRAPELLTDAFWKGFEAGLPGFRVVERLGDASILRRLEEIEKRGAFSRGSPEYILLGELLTIVKASVICPAIRDERHPRKRFEMALEVLRKQKADKH